MTGTDLYCLHTNQSRSYLNHLVYYRLVMHGNSNIKVPWLVGWNCPTNSRFNRLKNSVHSVHYDF